MKQKVDILSRLKEWLGYAVYTMFLMTIGIFFYFTSGHSSAVTMVIISACATIGISFYLERQGTEQ